MNAPFVFAGGGRRAALADCENLTELARLAGAMFRPPDFEHVELVELTPVGFDVEVTLRVPLGRATAQPSLLASHVEDNEADFYRHFADHALLCFDHRTGEGSDVATRLFGGKTASALTGMLVIRHFHQSGRMGLMAVFNRTSAPPGPDLDAIRLAACDLLDRMCRLSAKQHRETTGLSKREVECLKWIARGKTSADIGVILGLSEHTINNYVNSACNKLKAVNRPHAVARLAGHCL